MKQRLAIYPGTFDPFTNGHLSIVRRATQIFDKVVVAILRNASKHPLFTVDERLWMIKESVKELTNVEVESFEGLLVDFAREKGANVILRGLRAMSDFEYEFQLALMNRKLDRNIQTIFLVTDFKWFYTSSSIVKEAASFGGDVSDLVPKVVNEKLLERFGKAR
jgi:pantetheine-phosphate adenylyltransferase